jgi:hypothetical protein
MRKVSFDFKKFFFFYWKFKYLIGKNENHEEYYILQGEFSDLISQNRLRLIYLKLEGIV